jgi:hypothetical protein
LTHIYFIIECHALRVWILYFKEVNAMLEKLKQQLSKLWTQTRKQMIYHPVDPQHTDKTGDYVALEYGRHYIRLWLAQVYLAKQTHFLQTWYPAVHALVKFDFQGRPVEFPTIADASRVGMKQDVNTGDVIAQNFVLTPLIPFNNGTIDLDAGLSAIKGANYLESFITTLSDFSSLLAVPQFTAALKIAEPLAKGLQSMLSIGGVHLALHDGFAEKRVGGYWMAVRAGGDQINPDELIVKNDQLRQPRKGDPEKSDPLEGYDYMLFRLEVTEKGPDYRSLASIQDPMKKAHEALKDVEETKAEGFYRAAIIAAHEAPELTNADRTRVKFQLHDDFKELKNALGFSGLIGDEYDLTESMKRAMSVDMALKEGDPSFDDLFAI